jgi:LPXTG-motif cell wall-anchored protein
MKKKKVLVFFLFMMYVPIMFGQKSKKDSLKRLIKNTINPIQKSQQYHNLSLLYKHNNFDSVIYFNKKRLQLAIKFKLEVEELEAMYMISNAYNMENNYDMSLTYYDRIEKLGLKLRNYKFLALNNEIKGTILERKNDYNKAILSFSKAIKYTRKNNDSIHLTDMLSNLGYSYSMLYKDSLALESYQEGLLIAEKINNISGKCYTYNNLGSLYFYMSEHNKAIYYLEKSIKISKEENYLHILNSSYGFLSNVYLNTNEYDKSLKTIILAIELANKRKDEYSEQLYFIQLSEIYSKINDPTGSLKYLFKTLNSSVNINPKRLQIIYNNISRNFLLKEKVDSAYAYNKKVFKLLKKDFFIGGNIDAKSILGEIYMINNKYNKAISCFEYCLKHSDSLKDNALKSSIYIDLANCFTKKNKSKKALSFLKKVNELESQTLETSIKLNYYFYLNYKNTNNTEKALVFLEKSQKLKDSLNKKKIILNSNSLKEKYETQQKENEILSLKTLAQQKEIVLQESKNNTILALGGLFLVVVGGGLYFRKRKKDQKLQVLEASVKSSEEEKKRIGKELHDGIAGGLMTLVHKTEAKDVDLSHKLLNSYNQIRDLSHQLNNTAMHGELFMDRVFEIVPDNKENQVFEVQIDPPYLELNEPYSTHLYRIILELFTNNLKYANASKTSVSLSLKENTLTLLYADNGKNVTELKKGNGLKSIDNRVVLLNGTLNIDTSKGFTINIQIPFKV